MSEWKELKTLQEVAAAQAAGEEIDIYVDDEKTWKPWLGRAWNVLRRYRSRPRKKTKTIVLREALMSNGGEYYTLWTGGVDRSYWQSFIRWLDTPAREVEVPDE